MVDGAARTFGFNNTPQTVLQCIAGHKSGLHKKGAATAATGT
jgi:hypothetical protein